MPSPRPARQSPSVAIFGATVSGRSAGPLVEREADHALAGCAAEAHRGAARQDLDVAQGLDRKGADVVEAADALAVDDDQRLLGIVAELDRDFAEQFIDGADAIARDRLLIELAFGLDVGKQPRGGDDNRLRAGIAWRGLGGVGSGSG